MIAAYPTHRRRGFTAVELSMVVTVIAILALLILPMFQRQTDEARIAAAESDVRDMAIAMQLANANTGLWFTLQSLDNTTNFNTATIDATLDIPVNTWNDVLTADERALLAPSSSGADLGEQTWQGPYISFRREGTPAYFANQLGETVWFRSNPPIGGTANAGLADGPINLQYDSSISGVNFSLDRMPLDPWGRPYLFYGPDVYHPQQALAAESRFRNALFLSLGPDGLPGSGQPLTTDNLRRENGVIATGDDIFRVL